MSRALTVGLPALVALVASARPVAAQQAWGLPAGVGSVTFVSQTIDHVGRLTDDGSRLAVGQFTDVGLDVDVDYAFTDRWSISVGFPYIFTKYRGGVPPAFLPYLPVDSCQCWHSGWQDVAFTTRYNLINLNRVFVLTPSVSVGVPSHDYDYVGEAVIGRRLKEVRIAADVGQRLDAILPGLSVQGQYSYGVVERVLDIPNNRSNASAEGAFSFTRHLSARGILRWQRTHGGLRFPFEVEGFPDRIVEFHRMLRDNYFQAGGGMSYSWRHWDLSASYLVTASGTNSHDVNVLTVDLGWLFEVGDGR